MELAFGSDDEVFSDVIVGDVEGSVPSAAVFDGGKEEGGKRAKNRSSLGGRDSANFTFGSCVAMFDVSIVVTHSFAYGEPEAILHY